MTLRQRLQLARPPRPSNSIKVVRRTIQKNLAWVKKISSSKEKAETEVTKDELDLITQNRSILSALLVFISSIPTSFIPTGRISQNVAIPCPGWLSGGLFRLPSQPQSHSSKSGRSQHKKGPRLVQQLSSPNTDDGLIGDATKSCPFGTPEGQKRVYRLCREQIEGRLLTRRQENVTSLLDQTGEIFPIYDDTCLLSAVERKQFLSLYFFFCLSSPMTTPSALISSLKRKMKKKKDVPGTD